MNRAVERYLSKGTDEMLLSEMVGNVLSQAKANDSGCLGHLGFERYLKQLGERYHGSPLKHVHAFHTTRGRK